jgi:hypothetical protein
MSCNANKKYSLFDKSVTLFRGAFKVINIVRFSKIVTYKITNTKKHHKLVILYCFQLVSLLEML